MNCFHYVYLTLKKRGFNIPDTWNNYTYLDECKKIDDNPKHYLKNNIHYEYFKSFAKEVKNAQKNDIILHNLGVGIALDNTHFTTLNHLENVVPKPIRKSCKILRVI